MSDQSCDDGDRRLTQGFVFHGSVVGEDGDYVSVQLHPGLVLDVRRDDVVEMEEATDPVTDRSYVRIELSPDADLRYNFQPRLARLAAAAEGVPFGFGGALPSQGLPTGAFPAVLPLADPVAHAHFAKIHGRSWASEFSRRLPPIPPAALAAFTTESVVTINYDTVIASGQGVDHRPDSWQGTWFDDD